MIVNSQGSSGDIGRSSKEQGSSAYTLYTRGHRYYETKTATQKRGFTLVSSHSHSVTDTFRSALTLLAESYAVSLMSWV